MSPLRQILRYGLSNQLRSRWILGYAAVFFLLTDALARFGGDGPRVAASLLNVVLLVVPLVSVVFGTLAFSGSRDFIELLLAQPVGRRTLYAGLYLGLALPLALAFAAGVAAGAALHGALHAPLAALIGAGVFLTGIFTALAFLAGVAIEDRARGLGAALLAWFACAVLYDGVVLLAVIAFRDWPLEAPMLVLTLLNPVDLARVLLLMLLDVSALMGYTGAVFERFFGSALGITVAVGALAAWTALPFLLGLRGFRRADF